MYNSQRFATPMIHEAISGYVGSTRIILRMKKPTHLDYAKIKEGL